MGPPPSRNDGVGPSGSAWRRSRCPGCHASPAQPVRHVFGRWSWIRMPRPSGEAWHPLFASWADSRSVRQDPCHSSPNMDQGSATRVARLEQSGRLPWNTRSSLDHARWLCHYVLLKRSRDEKEPPSRNDGVGPSGSAWRRSRCPGCHASPAQPVRHVFGRWSWIRMPRPSGEAWHPLFASWADSRSVRQDPCHSSPNMDQGSATRVARLEQSGRLPWNTRSSWGTRGPPGAHAVPGGAHPAVAHQLLDDLSAQA